MTGRLCLAVMAFCSFLPGFTALSHAAPAAQIGVFRSQTGQWFLDFSGNSAWDRCGPDGCLGQFGTLGDQPAIGDWSGDGVPRIGVFRPGTGQWFLDLNGNSAWDGCGIDGCLGPFGAQNDLPVIGDWSGDGVPKIGVFRPGTGQWFLDRDGNGLWDDCGTDECMGPFGAQNDLPVLADVNGDDILEMGVFRPSTGQWFFDLDHDGGWSGCGLDGCFGSFGVCNDLPVAGAWDRTAGPGDPQNYFPLTQGSSWIFQGNSYENGLWAGSYQNTVAVTGTRMIDGITTTVVSMSNPGNTGPIEEYLLKDGRGVTNWGNNNPADTITPLVVAYQELIFPLWTGASFTQYQLAGVDLGKDLDGDKINERVNISSQVEIAGFEYISVPAGNFHNCAKVVNTLRFSGMFSGFSWLTFSATVTTSTWYAPEAGPVKAELNSLLTTSNGQSFSSVASEQLISVAPFSLTLPTNDIIFNPVLQKIFASIPSRAGQIGDTVAVIDPVTTTVEMFVPVGNDPGKLALSDDSRFLYVALDGAAAISRIDFLNPATPVVDLQFSLGSDPFWGLYYVEDMEVLPGAPRSIAVSRQFPGWSVGHAGVAIYDDGVLRPTTTPALTGSNVIEFSAAASVLYGYQNESSDFGFYRMTVDPTGVAVTDVFSNLITGFGQDITFSEGRIYATGGRVVNPETGILLGIFPVSPYGLLVEPDNKNNRVFFLAGANFSGGPFSLQAFDCDTLALVGKVEISGVSGNPGSLIRWGTNGLAFRSSGDQLFIFTTSLVP